MKYIRLRIANYRGIMESEVQFRYPGTTVVQGPNGVGKSSIGEAIRILFDRHAESSHKDVEAIVPVDRDEGPEVELEAESGDYHLVYFKRFRKKPVTQLSIKRPHPENLTGRQAHDKANEILKDTLDEGLWRALSIQQGVAIERPSLPSKGWLTDALDKAAGGQSVDPKNEGLFQSVETERGLYWTAKGRENNELAKARERFSDLEHKVDTLKKRLSILDDDIERATFLQQELKRLSKLEGEQEVTVKALTSQMDEIEKLENSLAETKLKLELAQVSEKTVKTANWERESLVQEISEESQIYKELETKCKALTEELKLAQHEFDAAKDALDRATEAKRNAETVARIRREDFDYHTNSLFLTQLRARKDRIDDARQKAIEAVSVLAKNKVDSSTLKKIADAERVLLGAKAQLETGAPSVVLKAIAEGPLKIDDVDVKLSQGETRVFSVPDSMRLVVQGILEAEFAAGASTEDLARNVSDAQNALDDICIKAEVTDPDTARAAFEERRTAMEQVQRKVQVETENLADLTYDDLAGKLITLESSVPSYLSIRPAEPTICTDLSSAKRERLEAEDILKRASQVHGTANQALETARTLRDDKKKSNTEAQVEFELTAKELRRKAEKLNKSRQDVSDEQLELNLAAVLGKVLTEQGNVDEAQRLLNERNPDRVKAQAETARGSLVTTRDQLQRAQTELTQVKERLRILGEEGLHEAFRLAENELERIERDNTGLMRRANAVKLLFETMSDERSRIRQAYVAPLRNEIERLGRLVFDSLFQVTVDEELKITAATLNDKTVPFDSLSGGEKEQISLIMRIACSMVVAKDGGAPLILDDALGYSDPDRRKDMGTVLAKAAKECQIIVFTCDPDRYSNIGEASVVTLSR